ncbi:hypothetical protein [Sulfitobacter sp. M23508]|uniref:hypothetical protein n=1 Tax=Sulfitobacter sp. M23508 TaxID=3368577 RepID=UPI003745FF66
MKHLPTRSRRMGWRRFMKEHATCLESYRIEQMVDLVESVPMGKASSGEMTLASDVPEFKDILDGSEQIVAVMDVPVYVRRISLP